MIEASPNKPADTLTIVPNESHAKDTTTTTKAKAPKEPKEPKEPKDHKESKTKKDTPTPTPTTPTLALAPDPPRRSRRSVSPKKSSAPAAKPRVPKAASVAGGSTRGRKKKPTAGTESLVDDESVASTFSSPRIPHETVVGEAVEVVKKVAKDAKDEERPVLEGIKVGVLPPSPVPVYLSLFSHVPCFHLSPVTSHLSPVTCFSTSPYFTPLSVRKTNLPQENDTAHLLATARAQIEASQASTESLPPPQTRVKRALEIDPQDEREETAAVPVKRARVEELEREVWVDGRRGRALLGLAIGLGARYVSV